MRHKKAVTTEVKKRYTKETKKGKTTILDEFIALTGYNRYGELPILGILL
ncbi:MAG: hypothetical protein L6405_09010 [Actinomycetia bacterium]|nr:hypothetical protein [Actinomycetes bacterium]